MTVSLKMKATSLLMVYVLFMAFHPILGMSVAQITASHTINSFGVMQTRNSIDAGLYVDGAIIRDMVTQEEVKLRGFVLWDNDWVYGFGDREPYAPTWVMEKFMPLTQAHFDQIRAWGFNTVRIEFFWTSNHNFESGKGFGAPSEPLESQPQVYNEAGLENCLTLIEMAQAANLYVIISPRVCYDPEYVAAGTYGWYGWSTHDYVVFNQLDSAGQRGLNRFVQYLEWLTERTMNESNVIAIEPWHFPYHRQSSDQERVDRYFNDVVPAMINAVRKFSNKMIILSPPHLGHFDYTRLDGPLEDSNIIYASGGYGNHYIVSDPDAPSWNYDAAGIRHPHPSWRTFQEQYNVPVMSTEGPGINQQVFGGTIPQDRLDLFDAVLTICDAMNGYMVELYSGPASGWGVLETNNPEDPHCEGEVIEILKRHIS
jgi:hypothetical protein